MLGPLYRAWNDKINVISRKDIDNLFERHVLHSLAIILAVPLPSGCKVLDAGTGGGFPGIPLAIVCPEIEFCLVDSTAKKLKVVEAVTAELGLENVRAVHSRLEDLSGKYDFVVGRAVTGIPQMTRWTMKNLLPGETKGVRHGLLYLKGGEFGEELEEAGRPARVYHLSGIFSEEYFVTKKLVCIFP
jgi:16S rRNA (guanine527-N7)-methyltransferase